MLVHALLLWLVYVAGVHGKLGHYPHLSYAFLPTPVLLSLFFFCLASAPTVVTCRGPCLHFAFDMIIIDTSHSPYRGAKYLDGIYRAVAHGPFSSP
jgi:hypothetical protein